MTAIQRFEDMHAWQLSRELVNQVYVARFDADIELRRQLTRAAVSVIAGLQAYLKDGRRKR
jgi:hypothetical protein